jgi:hypothetical protein
LIKVITEELYELADKEIQKKIRKERAELRKLIPVEVSITKTQLRSRGDRVRYNYDDVFDAEDDDEDYEEEVEEVKQPKIRQPSPVRQAPTRWSSRLSKPTENEEMSVDDAEQVEIMDTTPSHSEMDTASPTPSIMDTTPSDSGMDISRSQSILDMETISRQNSVMEL